MKEAILDSQDKPEKPGQDAGGGQAPPPVEALGTPGPELREARGRMKLSTADVGRQLKLHPRQVEALERDDYSALPGPVFVRGFMRNYARLVGLDGEVLIAAAEKTGHLPSPDQGGVTHGGENAVAPPTPGLREPLERDRGKKGWIPITVALIAIAAGIVYMREQPRQVVVPPPQSSPVELELARPAGAPDAGETAPEGESTAAGVDASAGGAPESGPSPAPQDADGSTVAAPQPPAPAPVSIPAPAPVAPPAPAPAQTAVAPPPPPQAAAAVVAANGNATDFQLDSGPDVPEPAAGAARVVRPAYRVITGPNALPGGPEIRFSFTGESWVDVRDGNGEIVFQDLNAPDTQVVVRGRPPFKVTVGNAGAVNVTFDRQPVDLASHTRADVARVTLE